MSYFSKFKMKLLELIFFTGVKMKAPKITYDSMPQSLKTLHTWEGVGYGVLNDGDGQVLYYRRDALANPEWRAQFKKEYGYSMPVPPNTPSPAPVARLL